MILLKFLAVFFASSCLVSAKVEWPSSCPHIISKEEWGGRRAVNVEYALFPSKIVMINHSATPGCDTKEGCVIAIKSIQDYYLDTLEYQDIGYNFIIGGDGGLYEGCGWHKIGAHTYGYNSKSIGIGFVGDYTDKEPNEKQLNTLEKFLECAIDAGELTKDYKLLAARQVVQKIPHFTKDT